MSNRFSKLALMGVAVLAFAIPASAQQPSYQQNPGGNVVQMPGGAQNVLHGVPLKWVPDADARVINGVNCSLTAGTPSICVHNDTDLMVTDLGCESPGWWGSTRSKEVKLPKGGVAPHTTTIVNFGGCEGTVVFTMPGGKTRRMEKQNTNRQTELNVPLN